MGLWKEIAAAEELIARAHSMGMIQEEGELWLGLGTSYYFLDLMEEAIPSFEQAISLLRRTQDRLHICRASCCLGDALIHVGRFLQAVPVLEEALHLSSVVGDEDTKLESLSHLSYALIEIGQPELALSYQQQTLELVRRRGEKGAEIGELGKLGIVYSHLDRIPDALACHEQALALARTIGNREGEAYQLGNLGATYTDNLRQPEQGLQFFWKAYHIFQNDGDHQNEAKTLVNIAGALVKAGKEAEALKLLDQAQAIAAALDDGVLLGYIASQRGKVYDQTGQLEHAMHAYEQALLLKRRHGDGREAIEDLSRLGMASLSQGRVQEALEFHQQALTHARRLDDRMREAQQLDSIANALRELGEVYASALYRANALALFRDLGDLLGEGRTFVNIATSSIRVIPWAGIQGNKKKALAGWNMGYDLLSRVEPSEAETVRQKIEVLRQSEGEAAFGRLHRGSQAYLRWFSFQRYWLVGDLLQFGLRDNKFNTFALQEWSAKAIDGSPIVQEIRQAVSASDAGRQHEARSAYQRALGLAHKQDDRHMAALLLGSLSALYGQASMWEESASCSRQAQEYFHAYEDWRNEMKTFFNLGTAQLRLLLPKDSLESFRHGLYLASVHDDESAHAIALRKMGSAYLRVGDSTYAKHTLEEAQKFIQKADFLDEKTHILHCLGLACLDLGYASKAITYMEQAAQMSRQLGNPEVEQRSLCLLAIAMAIAGKFQTARQIWIKVQDVALIRGEQVSIGQIHMYIALTYLFQEQLPFYLAHVRRSLDLTHTDSPAHKQIQQTLSQFMLSRNDAAYKHIWTASSSIYETLCSQDQFI